VAITGENEITHHTQQRLFLCALLSRPARAKYCII